jgi:hypothetical protein
LFIVTSAALEKNRQQRTLDRLASGPATPFSLAMPKSRYNKFVRNRAAADPRKKHRRSQLEGEDDEVRRLIVF